MTGGPRASAPSFVEETSSGLGPMWQRDRRVTGGRRGADAGSRFVGVMNCRGGRRSPAMTV
jgi:hypothetical protein